MYEDDYHCCIAIEDKLDSRHATNKMYFSILQSVVWEHTWVYGGDLDNRRHPSGGEELLQTEHNKCHTPGPQ